MKCTHSRYGRDTNLCDTNFSRIHCGRWTLAANKNVKSSFNPAFSLQQSKSTRPTGVCDFVIVFSHGASHECTHAASLIKSENQRAANYTQKQYRRRDFIGVYFFSFTHTD